MKPVKKTKADLQREAEISEKIKDSIRRKMAQAASLVVEPKTK